MINKPITLTIKLSYTQALAIIKQLVEEFERETNKTKNEKTKNNMVK